MANRHLSQKIRPGWVTAALTFSISAVIASAGLLAPTPAVAIHDGNAPFELDGNATKTTGLDDWDNVFELDPFPYPTPREIPTTGPGETFIQDNDPSNPDADDTTEFIQSNKDTHEVNTWKYGSGDISPPKDDITNAYAKAYAVEFPASDMAGHPAEVHEHLVVYFGADRFADDGDSAMGFWFFRNEVGLGPNNSFTGTHAVGDVLIQVDYRGAGDNEIEVFKWVGTGGNAGQGKLQRLAIGTSPNENTAICTQQNNGIPADSACIITNVVQQPSPWSYTAKGEDSVGANIFPARVFQEGGFDVTALVGNVCFSDFMAETRTSHSETASLKDFALGNFDLCGIDVEKECVADSQTVDTTDPANPVFTTSHLVTISNTGFGGSLRDVELADPTAINGNTCEIITVELASGSATINPAATGFVFDSAGDSVEVADILSGSISVELECESEENPFRNRADVKARAALGAPQDITDFSFEGDQANVCEYEFDAGIALRKWCQDDEGEAPDNLNPAFGVDDPENPLNLGVFLQPPTYLARVCVDVEISNTSEDQQMEVTEWTDDKIGDLLAVTGVPDPLILNPKNTTGDSYIVSTCYTGIPDQATGTPPSNPIDPTAATYTDTVNAVAVGVSDDTEEEAGPVSATCQLCPPHD